MSTYLFIRIIHILCGVIWVGAVTFVAFFLMPAMQEAGPDSAKVMAGLNRRRFLEVVPVLAILTVASGFWLYWRYTGGFDHALMITDHAAIVLGTGGVLGTLALIQGIFVLRASVKRAAGLMVRASGMPEGSERSALMSQAQQLRLHAARSGRIVAVLLLVTTVLMSVAFSI